VKLNLLSRLRSRRREAAPAPRRVSRIEALEGRVLLHNPFVTGVVADDRGESVIQFDSDSAELSPSSFNGQSVIVYTAGPDRSLGTADDVHVGASVRFTPSNQKLTVQARLPAGTGYRVKIVASRIPVAPGFRLDGEFNGTFPSGNGVAGGNFEFQTKNDNSNTPRMKFSTSAGSMTIRMRKDVAPKTVSNFFRYSNLGLYDGMFVTRGIPGFVIQGGSLRVSSLNTVGEITVFPPVVNEFNVSNTRGTIAMAKLGGDPNSATNQFFFNLADNSSNLDNQNGGFTVFADVVGSGGLAVMDAIAAKPVVDLSSQIGPFTATGVTDVPVNNAGQAQAGLNPTRDLVIFRRVSRLMRIARL
jgi:cyclophilin family peptidyl-prolyl cis-trans isomerase